METVLAVFHMLVALALIAIILIQDPKGGSVGMFSGGAGGGNSLLGATGAPSFLAKVTRYLGVMFAVTSIGLTIISRPDTDSVTDKLVPSQVQEVPMETAPEAATNKESTAPTDSGDSKAE